MIPPKKLSKSLTVLPPIKPNNKIKTSNCSKEKNVQPKLPLFTSPPLPRIKGEKTQTTIDSGRKTSEFNELLKIYENLLKENKMNTALIEQKEFEVEEKKLEMEEALEEADDAHNEFIKHTAINTEYTTLRDEIETELLKLNQRESELGFEFVELKGSNDDNHFELRILNDKITDIKTLVERGPSFIKGEIKRFQLEAAQFENENEIFEQEFEDKKAEMLDIRMKLLAINTEIDAKEGNSIDSNNEESDPYMHNTADSRPVVPPLNLKMLELTQDTPRYARNIESDRAIPPSKHNFAMDTPRGPRPNMNSLNDKVKLPAIRRQVKTEQNIKRRQVTKPPSLKAHSILPAINGAKVSTRTTNHADTPRKLDTPRKSDVSRSTAVRRGTTAAVTPRLPHIPKPPSTAAPDTPRRHRYSRS